MSLRFGDCAIFRFLSIGLHWLGDNGRIILTSNSDTFLVISIYLTNKKKQEKKSPVSLAKKSSLSVRSSEDK